MTRDLKRQLSFVGIVAIVIGGVLPGIGSGTISVMLPGISDAFEDRHSGVLIKMVATALGLGMMIGAPLGGLLADWIGRRPVLLGAALVFGVIGSSVMLATALWQVILARFVVGLASGAISACFIAVIGDRFQGNDQSRWLGYNGAVATLCVVMLNPIAGALADTGWRNGFAIYALAFPIAILIGFGIPRGGGLRDQPADPTFSSTAFPWSAVLLAAVVGTLATGTSLYWPFRLREVGVASARDLALYALPNVAMIGLAGFSYGRVRRYLSVKQVFAVAGFVSAVGLLIVAVSPQPVIIMVGLVLEGLAVGLLTPNLSTYAIGISAAATRARTIGIMKGALFGSPFLTQFALEPMSQAGGAALALVGVAALGAIFGLVMLLAARRETIK